MCNALFLCGVRGFTTKKFFHEIFVYLIPAPHLGRGVHGWKDPTRGVGVGLWVGLWDRVLKWP